MSAGRPEPGQDDAPTEGPPSARAQASLAADLRREVADARARFEEAGLRAEAHRLLGDDAGAAEVLREQEAILADVQDRLGRAVSAAVVQRDAEQVLADLTGAARPTDAVPSSAPPRAVSPTRAEAGAAGRRRSPALAGAASMVAMLGVVAAAVVGLTRGLDPVEIDGVSADATPGVGVDGAVVSPAPPPGPGRAGSSAEASAAEGPSASEAPRTPTAPAPTTARPPEPSDDADDQLPSPPSVPDLDTVVQDLIDAVAGLGAPGPADPPNDVDSSVPDLEDVVEELVPDAEPTEADDGGFVPDPSAQ